MKIAKVKIEKLNPAKYNPRKDLKPGDPEYEKLKRSIEEFGYVEPIIWNEKTGNVVGGHQRLKILVDSGYTETECVILNLDETKEKALNIALNKISGDWDKDKLEFLISDLKASDFDISITGFSDDELSDLFAETETCETQEDNFDLEKNLEEPSFAKRSDIWTVGKHRLMCGDSTSEEDIKKLMNGKNAHMLFTDPPYNVAFNGRSGKFDVIENDNLESSEFEKFILKFIAVIKKLKLPTKYICCNWKFYPLLMQNMDFKACIVWAKNHFGMGKHYRHQHEFILFDGSIHENIKNESDLWNIDKDTNYQHPTQKPIALAARAIKNSSNKNDIVLDLFGGSGSTMIASEQTNRICYMMEIDEKYVSVILRRFTNLKEGNADKISVFREGKTIQYFEIIENFKTAYLQ